MNDIKIHSQDQLKQLVKSYIWDTLHPSSTCRELYKATPDGKARAVAERFNFFFENATLNNDHDIILQLRFHKNTLIDISKLPNLGSKLLEKINYAIVNTVSYATRAQEISVIPKKTEGDFICGLLNKFDRLKICTETHSTLDNYGEDLMLYKPLKNVIYVTKGIAQISHEIAHMIEIPKHRLVQDDFGLSLDVSGFKAESLLKAMSREIRTNAIERHMAITERSSMVDLMSNFAWRGYADNNLVGEYPMFKTSKDVSDWAIDFNERTYKVWSKDRIEHEWTERVKYLNNWMNS